MSENMMLKEKPDTLATEMINMCERQTEAQRKENRKLYLFSGLIIFGLILANFHLATVNGDNNKRWIDYLAQYDFISQDGEGYNYINTDIDGDVVNGTEGRAE